MKIHVVFKTHFDIGYTGLVSEVIENFKGPMLQGAVSTCEQTSSRAVGDRYTWTVPAWPMCLMLSGASEPLRTRAIGLVESGQLFWHALPFTIHTETCGLEDIIRGFSFAKELQTKFGKSTISAKMTDVPGHTWILPTVLAKFGVRFLHLGCNPGCISPDVPRLFFWEGPDGSRVLTLYSKGSYGTSVLPPDDWPWKSWLALLQTNDNHGAQSAEAVDALMEAARHEAPDAEITIGTLDDFYRSIAEEDLEQIPVIRGDLADTWIHGIGSYPVEVSALRALRPRIADLEKLLSLSISEQRIQNVDAKHYRKLIEQVYENLILFGEHTLGLDVKTQMTVNRHYDKLQFQSQRGSKLYQRMETSWNEQRGQVYSAQFTTHQIGNFLGQIGLDSSRLSVFNGLSWRRDSWVSIDGVDEGVSICDPETGTISPVYRIGNQNMAYLRALPPVGIKVFDLVDTCKTSNGYGVYSDLSSGVLENRWYRLHINTESGSIDSLFEKSTDKEWVDTNSCHGFGHYQYDVYGIEDITEFIRAYSYRFYDWLVNDLGRVQYPQQPHVTYIPNHFTLSCESSEAHATFVLECAMDEGVKEKYGNAKAVALSVTLYADQPYIDLAYGLSGKEATSYIEAGHFVFPLSIQDERIHINKVGSVIDPATEVVKDANHCIQSCENWVDVSDGVNGIAFIPLDTPLFSIGKEKIYQFQREYKREIPTLFFNAYNTAWGTNFPQWLEADMVCRFRIFTHEGNWQQGKVAKTAMEYHAAAWSLNRVERPMTTRTEFFQNDSFVECSEGASVFTIKQADDGCGIILHIREYQGRSGTISVNMSKSLHGVTRCDFFERDIDTIGFEDSTFHFETMPFELHCIRVE